MVAVLSVLAAAALIELHPLGFRTTLDPSEEPMLRRGDPERDVYQEAIRNFGDDDLFVIGIANGDVFTHETLATLRRLTDRIRRLAGVRSTESLIDTTSYRYLPESETVSVQRLIDEIPTAPEELAAVRERALADRLYPRTIVARDGRAAAINVGFRSMTDLEFVNARLDERIQEIVAEETGPRQQVFVTGRKHVKTRTYHIMVQDLLRLIPLAVLVGATVAGVATGSLRMGVLPVAASLVATLWTLGLLAFLGRPLNVITLVLAPTLISIGSIFGVHILARFDALASTIGDAAARGAETIRETFLPVLISGGTTCIGFGALCTSTTPAIQEFGAFCFFGVVCMTVISVTAFPALLAVLPPPATTRRPSRLGAVSGAISAFIDAALARVARIVTTRPTAVLALWAMVTIVAVTYIPSIVVDTDYLTFFDEESDVRRDFAEVSKRLTGAVPVFVVVSGEGEGAFRDPESLLAVERLQRIVDDVPGVSTTLSVVDLVEIVNRALEKGDPAAERIPATPEEVADLLFLIPKNELRPFANSNHSKVNLLVRTGASGSAAVRELERRLEDAIVAARLPPGITATVTGNSMLFNKSADTIAGNQLTQVSLTTGTILLLVTLAFRSLRLGLIAMLPNFVPVAIFFGALGAGLATLSLPTSLIGCVALGISIDDTAHFIVDYRRERLRGVPPETAAADCIRRLGRPIVVTSWMETAGFLVLALSGFATLREFGYLSAMTMTICLVGDLFMLPAILVRGRV